MNGRGAADFSDVLKPDALARAGLFVAEGRFVVQRLLATPRYRVRAVLVTPPARRALFGDDVPSSVPVHVLDQAEMDGIVGFHIHRGCLAIAERPRIPRLREFDLTGIRRVVVLEGVGNPDNVGGIFRSAAAFGVNLVVLGPGCADPWYRKAIRTSMAATLVVSFVSADRWPEDLTALRQHGFEVLALTAAPAAMDIAAIPRDTARAGGLALLLGSEGAGLSPAALAAADAHVRIAMTDRVDSLNVTVAASIALHRFF